jgi:hypothetical protein
MTRFATYPGLLLLLVVPTGLAFASSISFKGDLRTGATVISCCSDCTLGTGNSDADFAQHASVVRSLMGF